MSLSDVVGGLADVPVFAMGVASQAVSVEEGPVVGVGELEAALAVRGDDQQIAVDQLASVAS